MNQAKLPAFEGLDIEKTRLKINGLAGDPIRALKIGESLYFLAEAEVESVNHRKRIIKENEQDVVIHERVHTARIKRYGEFDKSEALEILNALQEQQRRAAEEEAGISPLFGNFGPDENADDASE